MAVEQYSVVSHDWVNLEFIINDLTQRVVGQELHPTSAPTFADLTLTGDLTITGDVDITGDLDVDGTVTLNGLTASRLVWTDGSKALASKDLVDLIAGTADEIDVADDAAGGVVIGLIDPLIVGKGGTGRATSTTAYGLLAAGTTATGAHQTLAAGLTTEILVGGGASALPAWGTDIPTAVTIGSAYIYRVGGTDVSVTDGGTGASSLTDHGILLGSGTSAVTALGAATNGQLPIGSTGADPVLAGITGGTGITVTNGAGTITLSTTDGEIVHNNLSGLQGGTAGEYYHLTAAEHTELTAWLDDVTLSDGGAVNLGTGTITAANYTAANLLTACATNAGALDFSAASKTLTVEDSAVVSQDYSADASPTFATVDLTGVTDGNVPYMAAAAAGFADSPVSVSGTATTLGGNITVGAGVAGVDYTLTFDGETNDGVLTWMEDEDYFKLSDELLIDTAEKLNFRDTAIGIYSQADTFLDLFADGAIRIGDSSAGAPTNYVNINSDGDTQFVGGAGLPFGSVYGNEIAWTQASAVQNTWYEISDSDMADGQLHDVTHDGNGQLTVTYAGMYLCTWTLAGETSAGAGTHIQVTFSVNGTETNDGMNHAETAGADSQIALAGTAILDLAASDTLEVSIRTTDAGTPDISVDHLNITIVQVGGT